MKTVHQVLSMSTKDLVKAATIQLCKDYKQVFVVRDDFIYAVGEGPICLVSHMDTVRDPQEIEGSNRHSFHKDKPFTLRQRRNVLYNATGVLGADDRAGVFGCFELLRRCKKEKLPLPSIILTNGEESGGKGVGVFVATDAFRKYDNGKTRLFVEMDRQGCNDWVTYGQTLPTPVCDYVESFGFRKAHGSYSDIADLQEEYLIPSINVSIGYYGQHSDKEVLNIDEMYLTIARVFHMLTDPITQLYPVEKKKAWSNYGSGYNYYDRSNHNSYQRGNNDTGKKTTDTTVVGKTTGTGTTGWTDPVGMESIDMVLDNITSGGFCLSCGFEWTECDCGAMAQLLEAGLVKDEITHLIKYYLDKEDPIYPQVKVIYDALHKSAKTAPVKENLPAEVKDPHHVGKEGEVIPVEMV